jgi:dienelactone hydrolase
MWYQSRVLWALILVLMPVAPAEASTRFTASFKAHDSYAWFVENTCKLERSITGEEPDAAGKYPVLVYVHGTGAENGALAAGNAVIEAAAAAGFVAVAPTYVGGPTVGSAHGADLQTRCMFDESLSTTVLSAVCARPKADCTRIVVAGHSQGGLITLRAANWASNVKAGWALGVFDTMWSNDFTSRESGGNRVLPNARVRVVTGRTDMDYVPADTWGSLNRFTGQSCGWGTVNCLRSDGSGWYVVPHAKPPAGPTDGYADHCFMNQNGYTCTEPQPIDPFWRDGVAPWALGPALTWLKRHV